MRLVRSAAVAAVLAIPAVPILPAVPAVAGGGCHSRATEGSGTTVELAEMCMSPTVLRTEEGATVTFVNRDPMQHNVTGNGFYAELPQAGQTWQYRFPEAGTYAYACTLHPGMTGAVVVGDGIGAGEVIEVGPYRPEPVATPVTALASTTEDTNGNGGSVPWRLLVAAGLAIAAASSVTTRRLSRARG